MKISKRPLTLIIFLFLCTFIACAAGGDDDEDSGGNDNPDTSNPGTSFSLSAVTNGNGTADVSFGLDEGTSKFSVTAQILNSNASIRFTQLENDRGVNYLFADGPSVSLADVFSPFVKAFSVPSRNVDPGVQNGDTFFASVTSSNSSSGQEIIFTIFCWRNWSRLRNHGNSKKLS